MNFWQQILLAQASAALHAIFLAFGSKYFTTAEQAAVNVVIDALIDLPRRIHAGPQTVTFEAPIGTWEDSLDSAPRKARTQGS